MNRWPHRGAACLRGLLLILPIALTACAPQTVQVKRYEPPAHAEGQACLRDCEAQLAACQTQCKAERDDCEAKAEERARETLPLALDDYARQMEYYRRDLLFWRLNAWHDDWFFGPFPSRFGPRPFFGWYEPPPMAPAGPPTLASEIARAREACRKDCGCQPPYEACFLRCGGAIIQEQRPRGAVEEASTP